jgi:hypothetical protein
VAAEFSRLPSILMSEPPAPQIQAELARALQAAADFSTWMDALIPDRAPGNARTSFGVRYFSLALEHRVALLKLATEQHFSSAYALLRPMYEATMRGYWVSFIAKDGALAGLVKHVPKFDTVIKELNRGSGTLVAGMFHKANKMAWESFSDYAHGGPRQLSRWLTSDGVGPAQPQHEVASTLPVADHLALLAVAGLRHLAGFGLEPLNERLRASH